MHEALFYEKHENNEVKCTLCPWYCQLKPGQTGVCKVRENINGRLVTYVYNKVAALGTDPIEKKPLYHFYPGKNILSIGEVGCNMHCSFCQNHQISQCRATDFKGFHNISPEQIVSEALKTWQNVGIAYTYNEPFTFYEFMLDTARLAQNKGLKNVVVTNGYINPEPLRQALPFLDAFNIDLKGFNNSFYQKYAKAKLDPVLKTIKMVAQNGKLIEITNLVITGLNDAEDEFEAMVKWIAENAGKDTPLHLSRYFPNYKLNAPPTSVEKLRSFYDLAKKHLNHVYLGNISDETRSSTFCPSCGKLLIQRNYYTTIVEPGFNDRCPECGALVNVVS
ncbi:MAG: AmmeMemoRadiSam system radical SAM enzyme [Bacteroidota bacterium]